MGSNTLIPPLNGSVSVLPGFVDFRAKHNPNDPWVLFPSAEDSTKAISITYLQLAQATHRVAHLLRPGREGPEQETVAMLLNCDTIMYVFAIIGMVRAGIVPYPMSPKNSPEAVCHMLKATNCHRILMQPSISSLTSAVKATLEKERFQVELIELPELQEVLPSLSPDDPNGHIPVKLYPPPQIQPKANDLTIYIHSSGSTGMPKSIPLTHDTVLDMARTSLIRTTIRNQLHWACMALPTFHAIGVVGQVVLPLASGIPIAIFTPQAPAPPILPNPKNMLEVARVTGCDAMAAVPIFIEMWCRSPELLKYLSTLKCVSWVGGPLSEANGNMLVAARVYLAIIFGTTETGIINKVMDLDFSPDRKPGSKKPEDWAWIQIDDERVDARWADQGNGTFELQLLTSERHPLSVENLPDVRGYATRDVFRPHPTEPGLWRIVGRADDVIVLSTGEKLVPLPQEDHLNSVPFVSSAIMFGRGHDQPGVIVELQPENAIDPKDERAVILMRNRIWPHVEEANKRAPAFARLFKETILFADPLKPFARAAKGTAIRPVIIQAYEEEINSLYARLEESVGGAQGVAKPPTTWSPADVEVWLAKLSASINEDQAVSSTIDLFEQGFDSLSATFLRNRIMASLRASPSPSAQHAAHQISQDFIFANPTLVRLTNSIVGLVHPEFNDGEMPGVEEEIEMMIEKYSKDMPVFKRSGGKGWKGAVVLLTGSTGALGSHLLVSLLRNEEVSEVVTLNRGNNDDVVARQKTTLEARGIGVGVLECGKWTSLTGDMKEKDLGLESEKLIKLLARTTHIIHNAWRVDFNLSLSSFVPYISATRNLIDIASQCTHPVRFLFVSSVSAVYGWDYTQRGEIPEDLIEEKGVAGMNGYGEGKYVAEHVVTRAKRAGLDASCARIGQICGSTFSGDWSITEWVPILVKTGLSFGAVPDLTGTVSWIPMDITALTLVDILLGSSSLPDVFNLVHPRPVPWREIMFVPLREWVEKVEVAGARAAQKDVATYPAIKLLRFWKTLLHAEATHRQKSSLNTLIYEAGYLPMMQTEKAERLSRTLRDAAQVGSREAQLWVAYWKRVGFVP
ncbi:hypothetical protein BXZ70DRAFT_658621 [Cristinia sonorae]|uniref:Acetyl-CoA synthetase-like protein n=1 Tax=Cristinia sonorae TaxID=1940300 RepID=A0A8K0UDY2_9AGAR|nr:hypothetical protein BXZ70DRAFT_658621 [Cristinia sonorae]